MEQEQAPRWWAVVAVMIGIFLLVTAEQLPIGLLSQVASSMDVTPGMAGLMVTVPGVVAAFSAPLLPVAVGRLDRRIMLTLLMVVMVVGSAFFGTGKQLCIVACRSCIGRAQHWWLLGSCWQYRAPLSTRGEGA